MTTSKALSSIKERNSKAANEAELAALADSLDMVELERELASDDDELTLLSDEELIQKAEQEHATIVFEQARKANDTPYSDIVNEFASKMRPVTSVTTGKQAMPAHVNTNPQPVRPVTAPQVDRNGRLNDVPGAFKEDIGRHFSKGQVIPEEFHGHYDVVMFAASHNDAATTTLVNALLDRVNPELVIHGGNRGADAMARTWCYTRQVEQVECLPSWGEDALGTGAGPARTQFMLDLVDELQEVHKKKAVIFTFTLVDNQGNDRITQSVVNAVGQRNEVKNQVPADRQYIVKVFEAVEWLNDDFNASLPISTRGKVLEYQMPTIR